MKRKWYVIKNNNTNKYHDGGSGDDCWVFSINLAYFFNDKSDAEHEKDVGWSKYKFNDDCEIIELCENDEEYQELKEYNDELKQQIKELQNQKAIECLKECLDYVGRLKFYRNSIADTMNYIYNKIKKLEGE